MTESSNTDAVVFGLKVKLRPLLNSRSDYSDNWNSMTFFLLFGFRLVL
jgi:hypothetical protein